MKDAGWPLSSRFRELQPVEVVGDISGTAVGLGQIFQGFCHRPFAATLAQ
jgi:hypothetical protein